MPNFDIPLPYHTLGITKHTNSDRHREETVAQFVAKTNPFLLLCYSKISNVMA